MLLMFFGDAVAVVLHCHLDVGRFSWFMTGWADTKIQPPSLLYLMALVSKFNSTCLILPRSALAVIESHLMLMAIFLSLACCTTTSTLSSSSLLVSKRDVSKRARPDSSRAKSRNSLVKRDKRS